MLCNDHKTTIYIYICAVYEHIIGCNISELIDYQDQDDDHLGICAECNHGKEEAVKVGE